MEDADKGGGRVKKLARNTRGRSKGSVGREKSWETKRGTIWRGKRPENPEGEMNCA